MKHFLVTPMDWGLGHAARCIPVIHELRAQGCEVSVAGSGDALAWLQKEFPGMRSFDLPPYAPRYARNGSMVVAMARQLPRFVNTITAEHSVLEALVKRESIDGVISDNRYGCWSANVPSVFITHQSNVLMPKRFGLLQSPVRRLSERMINRFKVCWIPDFPAHESLAGAMISFGRIDVKSKVRYIGWLSRFDGNVAMDEPSLDVLAILSGPEPQRTVLENIVYPALAGSDLRFKVVRGLSRSRQKTDDPRLVNFMTTGELQGAVHSAALVIARSGYSTVMDMQALGKKVVFVPTPGQTEQEYLAATLMEKRIAFSMPQKDFDLGTALDQSRHYTGFTPMPVNHLLRDAIRELLNDNFPKR